MVRVGATGVCRSDWHAWKGHDPVPLPQIPGHELAGVVANVGESVTRWRVGDRVTVPFVCGCGQCALCLSGDTQVCPDQTQPGFTGPGSFADLVPLHAADTNLVAYLIIVGEQTSVADAVHQRDPAWVGPLLWKSEFRNILVSDLRQGGLTLESAIEHMTAAEAVIDGREFGAESESVLALAESSRCTAYDCEFVQVALALNVPLVTSDAQVLAAFPDVAIAPADFVV